jgi:hypothetical protein
MLLLHLQHRWRRMMGCHDEKMCLRELWQSIARTNVDLFRLGAFCPTEAIVERPGKKEKVKKKTESGQSAKEKK